MPTSRSIKEHEFFDLRIRDHEDVIARVENACDLKIDRSSQVLGIYGDTEGFATSRDSWVRVAHRRRSQINSTTWVGVEAAGTIEGVKKPGWFQGITWDDPTRGIAWRADEVELITSPVVGTVETAASLPDSWWDGLKISLHALGRHETERVGMSQAHLSRRIGEVFPGIDTTIEEWRTAHMDMHWGNLSCDGHLIDWEGWGKGPRGYDAACLWQSALPDPTVTARVERVFTDDFDTRSGKLARLLQCANAIRIARQRGEPTALSGPAERAAPALIAALNR